MFEAAAPSCAAGEDAKLPAAADPTRLRRPTHKLCEFNVFDARRGGLKHPRSGDFDGLLIR